MGEEDALLQAIRTRPDDIAARLDYADWLETSGHAGAAYIRAEVALTQSTPGEAAGIRRSMLALAPHLPTTWRDRIEQPDLLLAPPAPFRPGWLAPGAIEPVPYRALSNLDSQGLSPDLPWLSGDGVEDRLDQAEHEGEELAALEEVRRRAAALGLLLPPAFEAFAQDFPRRGAVVEAHPSHEVCLHDAVVDDFPRVGEGYLVLFFADMDYSDPHQRSWSLYLVPGVAWHCVVGFELCDDTDHLLPDDPELITYCAPSFQAFLYRWCREGRTGRRR